MPSIWQDGTYNTYVDAGWIYFDDVGHDPVALADWFASRADMAEEYGDDVETQWCRQREEKYRKAAEELSQQG